MKVYPILAFLSILALSISTGCDEAEENNTPVEGDMSSQADQGADAGTDLAGDATESTDLSDTSTMMPPDPPYDDCTTTLWPQASAGENDTHVQGALIDANENDIICLIDGVYYFETELSLDVVGVEIRGESRENTVLDFKDQMLGANGISVTSDRFRVSHLSVRDTPGDGIRVTGATGVTFDDIDVSWTRGPDTANGAYGIYPVQCQDVLVENSVVSHAADAGIYVGQSENIIVRNNEVFGNVAGIEVENSSLADVHDNHAHDNTAGILIFDLPNIPIQGGKKTKLHKNRVINNNEVNFADPGGTVGMVPSGTGILVMASDLNEITDNEITGNRSYGIAVVSYFVLQRPFEDENYDAYPEGNYTHKNTFENNGYEPQGIAYVAKPGDIDVLEDMLWDGFVDPAKDQTDTTLLNCFWENLNGDSPASFRNLNGPEMFNNQNTDLEPYICEGATLDAIEL